MWSENSLSRLLKTKWPIVQGPFGSGLSSVELTTTVSNIGALGSFGAQPIERRESEYLALWAGQSFAQSQHKNAAELLQSLVAETNGILRS